MQDKSSKMVTNPNHTCSGNKKDEIKDNGREIVDQTVHTDLMEQCKSIPCIKDANFVESMEEIGGISEQDINISCEGG